MPDINSGIVVRGLQKGKKTFEREEIDAEDRLQDASVNSKEGTTEDDLKAVVRGMDQSRYGKGFAFTTAAKIQQKGGRVQKAERSDNANHCQIFGLPLKDANNLFSAVMDWADLQ
jgi:hypothetical protein